jgi:hypothetical protein
MMNQRLAAIFLAVALGSPLIGASAEDPVFSGPQPGEAIAPFSVRGVFGEQAAKEFDLVKDAGGKPLAIVFVHSISRPSIGVTRVVIDYAARRASDGLISGIVFLTDDATETEAFLKRARHALPEKTFIGIYPEGQDGPGAYGLNRDVSLTVLVAKENKVTANFALVQPSVQVDAPQIAQAIVDVLGGGKGPTVEELTAGQPGRQAMAMEVDLRPLLAPVIRPTATAEEVAAAAKKVDEEAEKNEAFRKKLGEAAQRVVASGKLANYGTPPAQEQLRRWAEKYGAASD